MRGSTDGQDRAALELARAVLADPPVGLFTDFDGTISAIVSTPEEARIDPVSHEALRQLSENLALVAVVSGRSVADVQRLVALPHVVYVGNHGYEVWRDGIVTHVPHAAAYSTRLQDALGDLRKLLTQRWYRFEHKGLTAAIHYRQADDREAARRAVLAAIEDRGLGNRFRVSEGRMVVELRPPIDINKGTAVRQLVEQYQLRSAIFIGDDLTDVDGFRSLRDLAASGKLGQGLAVGVVGTETPTEVIETADVTLPGTSAVARFLRALASVVPASGGA